VQKKKEKTTASEGVRNKGWACGIKALLN